ncbi:Uncharacterised protein [Mycobacterium tuberculosis]|nr:Uncharacterised protein [Mycobacterium tuberculosis]
MKPPPALAACVLNRCCLKRLHNSFEQFSVLMWRVKRVWQCSMILRLTVYLNSHLLLVIALNLELVTANLSLQTESILFVAAIQRTFLHVHNKRPLFLLRQLVQESGQSDLFLYATINRLMADK